MTLRKITLAAVISILALGQIPVYAQANAKGAFTDEQYKKALWMVTRFYGAQRSGHGPNWLLMDHDYKVSFVKDKDVSNNHDLVGGWFDCGDHVLFGHTFFYSAYVLAKAYEAFPTGFHDLYNGGGWDVTESYSGYAASAASKNECKDWNIGCGEPNGIPDLLEELKYATDWIIKATPNDNTFYFQKGSGHLDHKQWVTSGFMSTLPKEQGGESDGTRPIHKNPKDGHMASFAAAALAVMSRIYEKYDADYAALCLEHAKKAYAYAKPRKNVKPEDSPDNDFYRGGDFKDPQTTFIIAAAEMFKATGDNTYITTDISADDMKFHYHVFDYANPHDLANILLMEVQPEWAIPHGQNKTPLELMRDLSLGKYINEVNSEKVSNLGGGWGHMRYPGNTAFSAALYSAATNTADYDQYIYNQVDFILGQNNANRSFVVGFTENGKTGIKMPHHRNVFLNDTNANDADKAKLPIPERNTYLGYMVGGNRNSTSYEESVTAYTQSEGGIDYSAGLLGALAYIVSKSTVPADTNSFGAPPQSIRVKNAVKAKHNLGIAIKRGAVIFTSAQSNAISEVGIYNIAGRKIFSQKRSAPLAQVNWNTAGTPKGMYVARVRLNNGAVVHRNVLIK